MSGAGRSVLVTGCSSGIGRAVAQGLLRRGYRVFATARRPADLQALSRAGLDAVPLELADPASVAQAAERVLEATGGRLYGLFNNAGYGQPGAVEDLSREALRAQFEANLFGAHELTCRLLPAMRRARQGRILFNSSLLGFVALPYRGAYNASKHAMEGLADTLRLELAGTGIHVSLIQPGPIASRFRANSYAAFLRHIDPDAGPHRDVYRALVRRLTTEGPVAPFTLDAEAVLARVVHALESTQPRARYRVTVPTHVLAVLKRALPQPLLDRVLLRISGREHR